MQQRFRRAIAIAVFSSVVAPVAAARAPVSPRYPTLLVEEQAAEDAHGAAHARLARGELHLVGDRWVYVFKPLQPVAGQGSHEVLVDAFTGDVLPSR